MSTHTAENGYFFVGIHAPQRQYNTWPKCARKPSVKVLICPRFQPTGGHC